SRTTTWSSAIRIRIRLGIRNRHHNTSAASGITQDFDFAADLASPFTHSVYAKTRRLTTAHASATVADLQVNGACTVRQKDVDARRMCMTHGVGERFLRN